MRTGTLLLLGIVSVIILSGRATGQSSNVRETEWLIGTWKNSTPKGNIYETWRRINDNELSGKSYFIKERDTIVFETIRLVQEQEGLFYIPIVKDQNNGAPVRFAATIVSETRLVFENPQHDFPQIISYTRIGPDSLRAEISGTRNGKSRKQIFPMERVR
jgi:hypothetical protein